VSLLTSIWPIGNVSAEKPARSGISGCSLRESPLWLWHSPAVRARLVWSLSLAMPALESWWSTRGRLPDGAEAAPAGALCDPIWTA
jgi:hypothetical protein